MKKCFIAFIVVTSSCINLSGQAQQIRQTTLTTKDSTQVVAEITRFFEQYGEELRKHQREAIAARYDSTGYYRMGNGNKRYFTFGQLKARYLNTWVGPKSFQWKDISIIPFGKDAVGVTGLFVLGDTLGLQTFSYSAMLVKRPEGWRIRIEDESVSPMNYTTEAISGSGDSGPYKYSLVARPGASITAHRHTVDMRITVRSGRKFILMGDLYKARVQRFDAASSFVIPANVWHLEWWEEETVEEIEIVAPWKTERATPLTPRKGD